jgi:hypothetical protein
VVYCAGAFLENMFTVRAVQYSTVQYNTIEVHVQHSTIEVQYSTVQISLRWLPAVGLTIQYF